MQNIIEKFKLLSPRQVITLVVSVVIGVSAIGIAVLSYNIRQSLSPKSPEKPLAGNTCYYEFSIPRPTASPSPSPVPSPIASQIPTKTPTSVPTPTSTSLSSASPTPASGICDITFIPSNHQAVCWPDPRIVTVTYKVNSLPTNEQYYMQTDWFVAAPSVGPHHYNYTPITAGQTYTFTAEWPGVGTPPPSTVEIHAGLNVYNSKGNLITPNCSKGLDYFWTPYVCKL